MNLDELTNALPLDDGTLRIPPDLSPSIGALLEHHFDGQPIALLDAQAIDTDHPEAELVFRGRCRLLGVDDLPATAHLFLDDDGAPQLILACAPRTWSFQAAFLTVPMLDDTGYHDARLTICSDPTSAPAWHDAAGLGTDLHFAANLVGPSLFEGIDQAFPNGRRPRFAGVVRREVPPTPSDSGVDPWRLDPPPAGIHLASPLVEHVAFGGVHLDDLTLRLYSPFEPPEDDEGLGPIRGMSGVLRIPSADARAEISGWIPADSDALFLDGAFEGVHLDNLFALTDVVGGHDATAWFPSKLVELVRRVELKRAALELGAVDGAPKLLRTFVAFELPNLDWSLLDEHLRVDTLRANIVVDAPLTPSKSHVDVELIGDVVVAGAPFELKARRNDEWFFSLEAAKDFRVPLSAVLAELAPGLPEPGDLTIDELYVELDTGGRLQAILGVAPSDHGAALSIPLGASGARCDIHDLGFELYRRDTLSAHLEGTTTLDLTGIEPFGFIVTLDYAGDEGAGWSIDARSQGALPLGDLMVWLANEFGVDGAVPSSLQDVELKDVYFTLELGETAVRFGGTAEAFELAGLAGNLTLAVDLSRSDAGGYDARFEGELTLVDPDTNQPHAFTLVFSKEDDSRYTGARYRGELTLQSIVGLFAKGAADALPPWLSPSMQGAGLLLFEDGGERHVLFSLDMDVGGVDLRDLPFAGKFIADGDERLAVSVRFAYCTTAIDDARAKELDAVQSQLELGLTIPAEGLEAGFSVSGSIDAPLLGDDLTFPTSAPSRPGAGEPPPKTQWKPIRRRLGPVFVDKAGVTIESGKVRVLLDAGLEIGGFTLEMIGFGISVPIKASVEALEEVSFDLDGLELHVERGDLAIAGGFARQELVLTLRDEPEVFDAYAGEVRIAMGPKSLSAFGAYVDLDGTPSFFIYGVAELPIGGPPEFFIEGFAAGFGLNSEVAIPPIEDVRRFILVRSAFGEAYFDAGDRGSSLSTLLQEIPPAIGRHWIAVGVKANHYKVVESFLLAVVNIDRGVSLDLLGLGRLALPGAGAQLAKAELVLHARFAPADGVFGVEARISEGSYVLNPMARLSGGFAFYSWFGEEHHGDFVVTLGGYHPQFVRPEHYPDVPRLSLAYQVSANVYVKGSAYFALTPGLLMAGGRLEGLVDLDAIQAWFVIDANFLMNLAPLHYEVTASVAIGATFQIDLGLCKVRKTVEIGAQMELWGPDFGGRATVDLSVVDFVVEFGAPKRPPPPLPWSEFKRTFLPPAHEVARIHIATGIVRELPAAQFSGERVRFVVDPAHVKIRVENLVPSKTYRVEFLGTSSDVAVQDDRWEVGVGPVRVPSEAFAPVTRVRVTKRLHPDAKGACAVHPIAGSVPASLWGSSGPPALDAPPLIGEHSLLGLELKPERQSADVLGPLPLAQVLLPSMKIFSVVPDAPDVAPQRVAADAVGDHTLRELLVPPSRSMLNALRDVPGFDHLPAEDAQTFVPYGDEAERPTDDELDELDDFPLLSSLGAQDDAVALATAKEG